MKAILIFLLTLYCVYEHVNGNSQQQNDDPTKPFWATRGRRSGPASWGRFLVKPNGNPEYQQDDLIPMGKSLGGDYDPAPVPEDFQKEVLFLRNKQDKATSLLKRFLSSLSSWDGDDLMKKRGDPKTSDPNNPFWAARG